MSGAMDQGPTFGLWVPGKGMTMAATETTALNSVAAREEAPADWRQERPLLTGAEIVCRALEDEGVDTVFGYPGGAVIPLYDALPRAGFHHVLVRFEQWAALAAEGYARATGKPGVCMATSGPGATNLVTGLADAMLDSVPIVAITGQVIQPLIGRDAFQEVDITGISLPVTKHNYLVHRIEDLAPTIKEAFHFATSGRPGPVLIDIPKTLFLQSSRYEYPTSVFRRGYQPTSVPNMRQVRLAAEAIARARKPLIMAGHGIMLSGATELFREFVEKSGIPVVFTLLGLGSFPESHPLGLGLMGMHGHRHVNDALDECDLLINIGARFDDRATGRVSGFAPNACVVHVDIDPAEIGKNVRTNVPVVGDAAEVLRLLTPEVHEHQLRRLDGLDRLTSRSRSDGSIGGAPGMARAVHDRQGDCRGNEWRGDRYQRRRSASDVDSAALRIQASEPMDHVGRARHDGLWPALSDRRQNRASRSRGLVGHRRRRLPDVEQ